MAVNAVIAWQLQETVKAGGIRKTAMAARLGTSRQMNGAGMWYKDPGMDCGGIG